MENFLTCRGELTQSNSGVPSCSGIWEYVLMTPTLQVSDLDPFTVASFVGAGFFVLLPLWVGVTGGKALLKSIF
jgi:hypothetical protein